MEPIRNQLKLTILIVVCAGACYMAFAFLTLFGDSGQKGVPEKETKMTVEELQRMPKIDAHAHIMEFGDTGEARFIALLEKHNMKWLDLCTMGMDWEKLQKQIALARRFHDQYPERVSWVTSFNMSNWGKEDWEKSAIATIQEGFDNGAVAVKVWKEIGMVLRDPDSSFVMIDDPRFDPIFDFIEAQGKPLAAHIGEPRACWLPIEKMATDDEKNYYSKNPQYHGYLHPEVPGYWAQVKARDRVLEKHPGLKVVGSHLGSLEFDVDTLAKCLDKYPNLAVDMAARIYHFQAQDRERVRKFTIKYQDRLLYGTDNVVGWNKEGLEAEIRQFEETYRDDYRFFATDEEIEAPRIKAGYRVRGLALPAPILKKIFYENAVKWYPGL